MSESDEFEALPIDYEAVGQVFGGFMALNERERRQFMALVASMAVRRGDGAVTTWVTHTNEDVFLIHFVSKGLKK